MLRLATFNILHGATTKEGAGDPEAVAEACASLDAEIIALEEVDKGTRRSGYADMAAIAAQACGMEVIFAPAMVIDEGQLGNALLIRGDIQDAKVLRLPRSNWLRGRGWPRNAILANVRVGEREISVAGAHLSPPQDVSWKQLDKVARALMRQPEPQVLMGDFNRTSEQVFTHPACKGLGLIDSVEPTYPTRKPLKRIDHIAVNGLKAMATKTHQFPFSDHLAVVAEVE